MKQIPDEIKRGMELLDQERPGWKKEIDLNKLNMGGCVYCILGQIYGFFDDGLVALKIYYPNPAFDLLEVHDADLAEAAKYGFALGDYEDYSAAYANLTQAWKEALGDEQDPITV